MVTIDIIILAVIGVFALTGYFRGLISTLFNMMSFVLSLLMTYYIFPYISRFVMLKTPFYQFMTEKISKAFELDKLIRGSESHSEQLNIIQALSVPKNTKEMLMNNNNSDVFRLLDISSFKDYISKSLASMAINVIVFIVLFIVISIILTILVKVLNLITKVTSLDQFNKISGAMLGMLMGLLFVFVGLAIVTYILSTKSQVNLMSQIDSSFVASFLYENNPIVDFLSNDMDNNHFWKILSSIKKKS